MVDFIAIFTDNLKDKEGNVVRRKLDGSKQKSEKSWGTCFLLFLFLGYLGAHRFYAGKIGTAILYIFTFGGVGIWALVDLISIVFGNFTDKEGKFII
ncbi:TM2 domain-containing protein [Brachyspira aalborgi]|uniref:TM2 domain-containing protein n=1 Tax=Brachyspira aalborgi TaxID=29522 RepID=A0AB38PY51_9SPIR|nr:TM2 domain-containing protein [Brachyspira aalborgi]TXJ19226.1 TM2 domain-containing protein [Brachyspira aalborgi]TXJ25352.1 TM2 domain-containing protein [Brachyspira aalborgi]TXJ47361.1 TM2 domain-containing protein [Brachyspira aalborgi]